MKSYGCKLGTLVLALGAVSVFSQEAKKIPPPPPRPPIVDAQTLAARRVVLLKRVELARVARAAEQSNEVAQGAPPPIKGSESGGQTSASTQPGLSKGPAPTVGSKPVIGLAPSVQSSPAVGVSPSPATAPGAK